MNRKSETFRTNGTKNYTEISGERKNIRRRLQVSNNRFEREHEHEHEHEN